MDWKRLLIMKTQQDNFKKIIYMAIAGGTVIGVMFGFVAATLLAINTL